MKKFVRNSLVAAATVTAAAGLTVTPASAQVGPWDVVNGGNVVATSTNTSLTILRNGATLTCAQVRVTASIPTTTNHSGTGIGSITSSTWTTCSGPLGLTFTVAGTHPWSLNAHSPRNATSNYGTISNISATISGPSCSARFTGSVEGYYDNANGSLRLEPGLPPVTSLTASNVSGCFGVVQNGDVGEFRGTFTTVPNTVDLIYAP